MGGEGSCGNFQDSGGAKGLNPDPGGTSYSGGAAAAD